MSILVQTDGGSWARSPEISISRVESFWRFFSRMETTSTEVQAPRAPRSISMGPGAVLCLRSASKGTMWPEGRVASNSSRVVHFMIAVCMGRPLREICGLNFSGDWVGRPVLRRTLRCVWSKSKDFTQRVRRKGGGKSEKDRGVLPQRREGRGERKRDPSLRSG